MVETKEWSIEPSSFFDVWSKSNPYMYKYIRYVIVISYKSNLFLLSLRVSLVKLLPLIWILKFKSTWLDLLYTCLSKQSENNLLHLHLKIDDLQFSKNCLVCNILVFSGIFSSDLILGWQISYEIIIKF